MTKSTDMVPWGGVASLGKQRPEAVADLMYEYPRQEETPDLRKQRRREEYMNWLDAQPDFGGAREQLLTPDKRSVGMNLSTAIFLVDNTVRAVSGVYEDGGKSAVFKTRDPDIKVDDIVVVPSGTRHGFTTFKVKEVDVSVDYDQAAPMHWVVARVDMADYVATLQQEANVMGAVKSADERERKTRLVAALKIDQTEIAKLITLKPAS